MHAVITVILFDEQHEAMHQEIVHSTAYVINGIRSLNIYALAWVEYNLK